jgi:hypothetical protein
VLWLGSFRLPPTDELTAPNSWVREREREREFIRNCSVTGGSRLPPRSSRCFFSYPCQTKTERVPCPISTEALLPTVLPVLELIRLHRIDAVTLDLIIQRYC